MKIYLREISDLDSDLDFTQEDAWLLQAVERVDETGDDVLQAVPTFARKTKRPIDAHFTLRNVDEVIVVNGSVDTYVELLCSRCASLFKLKTDPHFSSLFCQDPAMAGIAHLDEANQPVGQNRGVARHAHDTGKDLDITYLSENFLDLGAVVTEQLQLQVPFQPLCRENCKGMCTHCGADLNVGRCACAKIAKESPFSALKDLKIHSQS